MGLHETLLYCVLNILNHCSVGNYGAKYNENMNEMVSKFTGSRLSNKSCGLLHEQGVIKGMSSISGTVDLKINSLGEWQFLIRMNF